PPTGRPSGGPGAPVRAGAEVGHARRREGSGSATAPGWRARCGGTARPRTPRPPRDRKSTRLNSSHVKISYAVFCLKKKKTDTQLRSRHRSTYGALQGPHTFE